MEMKRADKKGAADNQPGDKLIFTTKVFSDSRNVRVGISKESATIVNEICLRTGMTASEIVNRMIAFCEPKVEIIPGFYYEDETTE
jgi:hypothetical protein